MTAAPSAYVIVGSGKTATDGIVWLLANGAPSDRIVWVRPRDPWMLNRTVVQPDPVAGLGLAADTMAAAAAAESLDNLFLRLEAAGVLLRIDPGVIPTMAKTPTLATWELELLRTIEHVVRLGHIEHVTRREIVLDGGSVPLAPGSLVVHCAASGLQYPPMVPIWGRDKIRLQTIRVGFPCFNAALAGYVEVTRDDDCAGARRRASAECPPGRRRIQVGGSRRPPGRGGVGPGRSHARGPRRAVIRRPMDRARWLAYPSVIPVTASAARSVSPPRGCSRIRVT